jgi:hypothetical protein
MRHRRLPHLVAFLLLACAPAASAWQTALTGSGSSASVAARAVATAPAGEIFVVETKYAAYGSGTACTASLVKSRADDGGVVWRQIVSDRIGCDGLEVATDGRGDAVVFTPSAVMKLAGSTGATLWGPATVTSATGTSLVIAALAVDATWDVIVAGQRLKAPEDGMHYDLDLAVARLAGADGAVRWQTAVDGVPAPFDPRNPSKNLAAQDGALAVAIDASGDVVAAGYVGDAGSRKLAVVKLDGANGSEAWRYTAGTSDGSARAVAVDAAGATTVAGEIAGNAAVARLTAAGDVVWEQTLVCALRGNSAADVKLGPDGDAYVVGIDNCGAVRTFAARLDHVDGFVHWRWVSPDVSAHESLVLAGGDPVLLGVTVTEPESAQRFSVVRLNAESGDVLWTATPAGSRDYGDMALGITAVDDDVVAVGALTTGVWGTLATVQRFTNAGAVAWRMDTSAVGAGYDVPVDLALGATGDVVVVGALQNVETDLSFAAVKLGGADGTVAWRREIDASADLPYGVATAVAIDHAGNVVAVGTMSGAPAVAKLDAATGAEIWRHPSSTILSGVAVDANGDAFVVDSDATVAKLAGADGVERWRSAVAAASAGQSRPIVVDATGDVVVAASGGDDDGIGTIVVVKLDGATGAERWRYGAPRTHAFSGAGATASSVAVAAAGDVLVTGVVENTSSGEDLFAAKIDGASGAERWRYEYDGSRHSFDRGWSIDADRAGDVIVSGTARETNDRVGAIVMKLDGATGAERWQRAVVGPESTFVAWKYGVPAAVSTVDRAGDVLVTGTTYDPSTGFDFTVAKLAGEDGKERWRRRFDGSAPPTDSAPGDPLIMDEYGVGVVTDPCGNVFALGRVVNESAADMLVVGLDGRTGGDALTPCAPGTIDGCPPVPRIGCKRTVKAGTSTLAIDRLAANSERNRLQWRWRGGEATMGADLGSPLGASDYAVCLYAQADATPHLVLATEIPGAESCGNKSCWRPGRRGDRIAYIDDEGRHEGVTDLRVEARAAGKSELVVQAAGSRLAVPPLPLARPLLLQVNAEPGACFEATFDAAGTSRADGTSIRARGGR